MHDGQNLFDTYTAFSGEWLIDESIGAMMDLGYGGAIVVGIDNGGGDRINELSPSWPLSSEASEYNIVPSGEKYAAFVVETVKPYVDSHYKTLSDAANTFIGGSSMGGVMSFFMTYTYPEVFGNGLFFSSALWLYESGTVANFINSKGIAGLVNKPKVYIYVGGAENSITAYVSEMYNNLKYNGYTDLEVKTHIEPNKGHNESAWSLEFPKALRWLVDFTG
jgi:alpha-glucosidase